MALGSVVKSPQAPNWQFTTIAKANSMENIKSTELIPDSCDDKNQSAPKIQSKH